MTRAHDQQNTPFRENIRDFWGAIKGEPRTDGRGWLMAVLHEGKNTFIQEPIRQYPGIAALIILFLLVALLDCRFSWS